MAQELARVSVTRPLTVTGIGVEPRVEDVLGLSRVKFQGVIAAELTSVGYRLADPDERVAKREGALPALNLVGVLKEEICDDEAPAQCRIAMQWELQDQRGLVVYRTTTRAVDQSASLAKMRRALVEAALRSLLQRRRFSLQLTDGETPPKSQAPGPLGFKQCRRGTVALPQAARAVAASLVFVESGSSLALGAIVSGEGLILTEASVIEANAPLRVRFSAEQTLPALVVALNRTADVALLHVAAHTDATCLPLREASLTAGMPVFGVSSDLSEDRAVSLTGGVVAQVEAAGGVSRLLVDSRIARAEGGPLVDEQGQLAATVSGHFTKQAHGDARAVDVLSALRALDVKPAAITDPRLLQAEDDPMPAVGYVHDRDDPPFVLAKRYTYGTSVTAHRVRTASLVTGGIGLAGVAATWLTFRGSSNLSSGEHNRFVFLNDVSWVLVGLGAVGFGTSYALPEGHDVVAARSTARRQLFFGVGVGSIQLGGRI